jgi:glycosyltransferase involved in cell wall biosynthesis
MTISVVIPTYNRSHFLAATLRSVLSQTRPADEILVVDDGSTDDTAAVVEGLCRAYPSAPLRYHYQTNAHLGAARNTGQRLTSGEALLFLDSDDLLLPDALKQLEKALTSHPKAALVYGRSQIIDAAGTVTQDVWTVGNEAERDLLWDALIQMNFIRSAGCVLIRRDALVAAGPWDESLRVVEDWDIWLRLAEPPGAAFARVPWPLLQYRVHGQNMSGRTDKMEAGTRILYQKHALRHTEGSPRRRQLEALLRAFPHSEGEGENKGAEPRDRVTLRHRQLRSVIERVGIAPLYRLLPVGVRLRVRDVFGVDRWA